jgi:hemolysin activation/secretion protein
MLPRTKPAHKLLSAMLAALALPAAHVAYAADPVPNAGSLLQQTQPVKPLLPSNSGTGLTIQQNNNANLPPSTPFLVKEVHISGNTLFDAATLHAVVAEVEGKNLTLTELGNYAARITDYYRSHGYSLARAVIPAQSIQNGVVRIQVVEAAYGKIILNNHSLVGDRLLQKTLAPLQAGQAVAQEPLDHAMLLLSDIPGAGVAATLKPGDMAGTSDLQVDAAATPSVIGNAVLDNNGNSFTGRARAAVTVNFIDPLHIGDVLSLHVLTSGRGMNYGSLSYDALVSGSGTHVGGSASALHYILGDTLTALDAHGAAQVESLWIKQAFVRSRNANVYGQVQYNYKQLNDDIDAGNIMTERHLNNWTFSVNGDWRDMVLDGGVNAWNLGWTAGRLGFDNAAAQLADAGTAKTQGSFSKWNADYFLLQSVGDHNAISLALSVQWASTNLDASEKMVAGGPYTVRAYDIGALSGDSGLLASLEWRHDIGQFWGGQWQAVTFIDSEHVIINATTWAAGPNAGPNSATLSGAGFGFNWSNASRWYAKLLVAAPIGATPPVLTGSNNKVRGWIEIGKNL